MNEANPAQPVAYVSGGAFVLGAVGVSGAPGGKEDDACAAAGIAAIRDGIEF